MPQMAVASNSIVMRDPISLKSNLIRTLADTSTGRNDEVEPRNEMQIKLNANAIQRERAFILRFCPGAPDGNKARQEPNRCYLRIIKLIKSNRGVKRLIGLVE